MRLVVYPIVYKVLYIPILHDEQMSNRVGVEHGPVIIISNINFHQGEVTPSTVDGSEILLLGAFLGGGFKDFLFSPVNLGK